MHQHKCSLCGTMWQHGEEWDRDTRAHECPTCGCHQFRVYKVRNPAKQPASLTSESLLAKLGDADPFVRSTTLFALDVGDPVAPSILPKLAELATGDAETLVRLAAVETLRRFGTAANPTIPAIVQALGDPHQEVRRAAALTLGDLGPANQSTLAALTKRSSDNNPRVREAVAAAMRKMQSPGP